MKNPFKLARRGFDSLIAKGHTISGTLTLEAGSTTIIDGTITGDLIHVAAALGAVTLEMNTTLVINGRVETTRAIVVPNVTVTGHVECDVLEVQGVLAIQKGARVVSKIIRYKTLIVDVGAVINGTLESFESTKVPE